MPQASEQGDVPEDKKASNHDSSTSNGGSKETTSTPVSSVLPQGASQANNLGAFEKK